MARRDPTPTITADDSDTDGGVDAVRPAPTFERPSKSRRKAVAHDLQALGRDLSELKVEQLATLPLAEPLHDALLELKRTRSHEGKRRQLQLVGKLMRQADAEPLRDAVAALKLGRAEDSLALHKAEYWREVLVADDSATTRFASEHADVDVQQLRALVRRVRQERQAVTPPGGPGGDVRQGKAWRELFKLIRPSIKA